MLACEEALTKLKGYVYLRKSSASKQLFISEEALSN